MQMFWLQRVLWALSIELLEMPESLFQICTSHQQT
jgi:hypothetical protein